MKTPCDDARHTPPLAFLGIFVMKEERILGTCHLEDRIKEGLEHDPLAKKIIALAKDRRTHRLWLKGDMLFTKGKRLYVPKWGDLRRAILKEWGESIIVVVDRFLKYETFIAAPPDITANDTAKLFFKNMLSYNMQRSETTRKSPFELVTGRQPLTPNALATSYEGSSLAAYKTMKEWHEQADLARASLDKADKKMKKWADERRRHVKFELEDQVMVKLLPQQFKLIRKVHKGLILSYEGPFSVIGRVGKQVRKRNTYCGGLRTRSRDTTRMARRGRRELRWEKVLEALESPWKLMKDLEASCR
nr:hypothetical protein CTI12_AA187700 [Tanacetum cinerariifolium]